MSKYLTTIDHNRDITGMRYIYPVISRRARGVSIGINLNPNNACNWRCIYCQVPNLQRGGPPPIDLPLLEQELRTFLHEILHGNFMQAFVPEDARHIMDIAFSGNGEPTMANEFPQIIRLVGNLMHEFHLPEQHIKLRLITNGSQMAETKVLDTIAEMRQYNGEVWFKVDTGTTAGFERINSIQMKPENVIKRLIACAQHCPTWVQSCMFCLDGNPPDEAEILAYLNILQQASHILQGVHVYGVVRPSYQPEVSRISAVSDDWMHTLASRIQALGLQVQISP